MTSPLPPGAPPERVVVVDNDEPVRRVLTRALASEGYETFEAEGTDAALALLRELGGVPLIVSDIHMPGRNGIELLVEVLATWPDTAVLMLTGDADVQMAVESLKLGALDYLAKPVLVEELRQRVRRALAKRKMTIEFRELQSNYAHDLERQVQALSRKNREMFVAQVQMAVRMLEAKDPYTRGHSDRVALYAQETGRALGLDAALLEQIRLGGTLHDIGKIGTRDAVLNKPGPLTDEEFAEIRRHTTDGEEMLSVLREDHPVVLEIVRWHHERLDGSGFPDGLDAEAIPITARIVAVADAFDAMTTTRAYRGLRDPASAFEELDRCCGHHFDPAVVRAFRTAFPDPAVLPLDLENA
ncbi:MAG: HD domain-containing phosphohydrolase [Gemmatimonadota bacterium]